MKPSDLRQRTQNRWFFGIQIDILPRMNAGDSYWLYTLSHTMPSVGSCFVAESHDRPLHRLFTDARYPDARRATPLSLLMNFAN
jgi:hypothetical protein